jgi:hypothetical protein
VIRLDERTPMYAKAILTADEFEVKKTEFLSRL